MSNYRIVKEVTECKGKPQQERFWIEQRRGWWIFNTWVAITEPVMYEVRAQKMLEEIQHGEIRLLRLEYKHATSKENNIV